MRKIIWTYDKCKEEALKYSTRMEFKQNSGSAYSQSVKNKWLNNLCAHMKQVLKPKKYWNFETCKTEALKHETRTDFAKAKGWAYQYASINGWLDDICAHMTIVGNYKKRCVYAYEFSNNFVYVGLTYNFEERWKKRMLDNNDVVKKFINKTNLVPARIQLTNYVDKDKASLQEIKFLKKYHTEGWNILNRVKGGSLGGNVLKWTKDVCKTEALKYKTLKEFRDKNNNCLAAIYKNKWHKELLKHLIYEKKYNGYWNKQRCKKAALECGSKTEFYKKYRSAYSSAKTNGWFNSICAHMKQKHQ